MSQRIPASLRSLVALTFCLAFIGPPARAEIRHVLYSPRGAVSMDYDALVLDEQMHPGDSFVMGAAANGDPIEFNFHGYLGHGKHNAVVDIGGGLALRMRRRLSAYDESGEFLDGYDVLSHTTVPIVRAHPERSQRGRFVIVDKVDVRFTLHDLIYNTSRAARLTPSEREAALDALIPFAKQSCEITDIEDFEAEQLGFVDGKWQLLETRRAMEFAEPTSPPGDNLLFSRPDIQRLVAGERAARIRSAVTEERRQRAAAGTFLKDLPPALRCPFRDL